MEVDDWHVSGLSVGQVAERMNIAPSAVRWYADHGLLPSERTASNQRRFYADVLWRVAMIRAAQRVGLSIGEIREALSVLTVPQHRAIVSIGSVGARERSSGAWLPAVVL
jgi:DNA-binding transcriptional MerR regulator